MIHLKLPKPISANHFYLRRGPMTFIGPKGLKYIQDVKDIVEKAYDSDGLKVSDYIITGPVKVDMVVTFSSHRRSDIDNLIKHTVDSLTKAGIWSDDSLIWSLSIKRNKEICKNNGSIDVFISDLDPDSF